MSKPGTDRADPCATPSLTVSTIAGRSWRSASLLAASPTIPGCQSDPAKTSTRRSNLLGFGLQLDLDLSQDAILEQFAALIRLLRLLGEPRRPAVGRE